jgi:hypothetical protein
MTRALLLALLFALAAPTRAQAQATPQVAPPATTQEIDAIFDQGEPLKKWGKTSILLYTRIHDGVGADIEAATAQALGDAARDITRNTGLNIVRTTGTRHHDIWINVLPIATTRQYVAAHRHFFPYITSQNDIDRSVCFARVMGPPADSAQPHRIARAIIYLPSDLGHDVLARCLSEALPTTLGFTPESKPAGAPLQARPAIDAHTLRHLAILADARLQPGMTRAQAKQALGVQ